METHLKSFSIKSLAVLVVSTTTWAYVVKKGDTLSGVAYKNVSTNVYGKDGSINKLLVLNPQIKNPNFIKPGLVINFGREIATEPRVIILNDVEENNPEMTSNSVPLAKRQARLALTPFYNISTLTATDNTTGSESIIASKSYPGLNASYIQEWSKDFQTAIHFEIASVAFEKPASATKALQDKNKFLSEVGIQTHHRLGAKTHLNLGLGYGKELFIRAASTQAIAVDAVNVPTVSSKISYDLKDLLPFTLGVSASYAAKMPGETDSYKIKSGHEFGASVYLKQLAGNSHIQTELGFSKRSQNTSFTSQSETNVMLGVRFFFSAGSTP